MNAYKKSVKYLWCLFALALVGCGASPSVRYYMLEPKVGGMPLAHDAKYSEKSTASVVPLGGVAIGPFRLADYLDRPQIVTRTGEATLQVNEFDRWSEPLASAIQRTIAINVSWMLNSDLITEYPIYDMGDPRYQVQGRVTRLDVDASGQSVLQVQWLIRDGEGVVVIPLHHSRYTERTAASGSYTSMITSFDTMLANFSRDIADALIQAGVKPASKNMLEK